MDRRIESYRSLLAPASSQLDERVGSGGDDQRRTNLASVLALLHLEGQQSRTDIVQALNLSRSTVSSLIGELNVAGAVEEAGVHRQRSPGRPSQVVRMTQDIVALAIEIAPAYLAVATVEFTGRVRFTTRRELPSPEPLDSLLSDITRMTQEQLDRIDATTRVSGIGVAVHGLVSADGIMQHAPNLGWSRTDVRAVLADQLPGHTVLVGNDSTLATVGEHLRGSLRGVRDGLMVVGDVGVGGGAIVEGRLLQGGHAMAAEVGHMAVELDGQDCGCGSTGCWETRIGLPAILRETGLAGAVSADGPVALIQQRADDADPMTVRGLEVTGRWLGSGLASLVNLLNPNRIVVGGRLGQLLPLMLPTVMSELDRRALDAPRALCDVVSPELGSDAALIGAAEHAFWHAITTLDVI